MSSIPENHGAQGNSPFDNTFGKVIILESTIYSDVSFRFGNIILKS
jgi:hypothetical protein